MKTPSRYAPVFAAAFSLCLALGGCGQAENEQEQSAKKGASNNQLTPDGEPVHGGYWCYEHAIPEEQCAMCQPKLAAEMREKGDWCEEHTRPDSLCFKCHPENAEKFIALYEAKYGKKPPKATD